MISALTTQLQVLDLILCIERPAIYYDDEIDHIKWRANVEGAVLVLAVAAVLLAVF